MSAQPPRSVTLDRRRMLQGGLALAATALAPAAPALSAGRGGRVLLLLELNGGNDALNTVVPHRDPAYRQARPSLALPSDQILPLDERLGLNRALEPLMPAWQAGELAIPLGVGYPRPNRSHFRSIEIWNSASDADALETEGWVSRLMAAGAERRHGIDGIVLGGPGGPLAGPAIDAVVMRQPERFLRRAGAMGSGGSAASNAALRHILRVRSEIHAGAREIEARLAEAPALDGDFPRGPLGRQLETAARLILAEVPLRFLKLSQGGYDTHANQSGRHRALLGELGQGLAAFRMALQKGGAWQRVMVMTYAEFGRRVAQNASGGTDHGTAAAHLLLGGGLRGGLYGRQPSLTDLDGGDLRHTLDFRQLYATAAHGWLGLPRAGSPLSGFAPLDLLA